MESILTEKGQTTVPKAVREALRIKPNQRLEWEVESNGTVRVRRERSVLDLFGSLASERKFPGRKAERAAVQKRVARDASKEG